MPDFVNVKVYESTGLRIPGSELLRDGTASGTGPKVLACEPSRAPWRRPPRCGSEYIIEGTPVGGGVEMAFVAECRWSSTQRDHAEFEIARKL